MHEVLAPSADREEQCRKDVQLLVHPDCQLELRSLWNEADEGIPTNTLLNRVRPWERENKPDLSAETEGSCGNNSLWMSAELLSQMHLQKPENIPASFNRSELPNQETDTRM